MMSIGHGAAAGLMMPEQNGQSAPGPGRGAEVMSLIVKPERPHPSTQQIGSVADMTTMSNPRRHAKTLCTAFIAGQRGRRPHHQQQRKNIRLQH